MAAELVRFDPRNSHVHSEPYTVYERYRRLDPVHWGLPYAPGAPGCWYLFRHEHVVAFLRDRRFHRKWPRHASDDRIAHAPARQRPFLEVLDRMLLSTDPPEHRRLRTLVGKAFGQRAVESYRPLVRRLAEDLVDALPRPAEFDVVERLAAPLSFTVICAVLGVPTEHTDRLRTWSARFSDGLDLRKQPDTMAAAGEATVRLLDYFGELVRQRRREPRDDLVSALVSARDDEDRLSEDELLAMIIQLIFAGHETTVAQIGATVLNLLENPDQLALLRADPGLIGNAVEESLRRTGSAHTAAGRKPSEDVRIGDKLIRAGEPVIAFIAAANRDPDVFDDPHRFDIRRDTSAAVPFGAGVHYCLGAQLARLEAETAVATLFRRLPDLQPVPDRPSVYRDNIVLPGIEHLIVREPAARDTRPGRAPVSSPG
ncbi:cytochrome P450 [Pseudonocardia acaciae]|uniref:cytochrome P450 n=1 Tax=Pseudonocardia acaciae TaxID=551276 RepID=UPI0007E8E91C|nr:cytochrome P450 [Pseudonocardia acaciae]